MAINVVGFKWNGSDENHKYDFEALENIPTTDIGKLDIDTTADAGTDDGDLYRAINSFSWSSVISGSILSVKKLFTSIITQLKTNTTTLSGLGDAATKTVVNNLTRTTSGAVLDARQGKELQDEKVDRTTPQLYVNTSASSTSVDGQLTSALTTLGWTTELIASNILSIKRLLIKLLNRATAQSVTFTYSTNTYVSNTSGHFRFVGNETAGIVLVNANFYVDVAPGNNYITIGTTNRAPKTNVDMVLPSQSNKGNVFFRIDTSGNMQIWSSDTTPSGWYRAIFAYAV